jgi:peptidoglycan/LPS O-acetylase OafA/YrhL
MNRYRDKLNWRSFYFKRFLRISIPQWIGFIVAFLIMFIVKKNLIHSEFLGTVVSFLGVNYAHDFWSNMGISPVWVIGEWFTTVIILIYAFFPLMRFVFLRHRWSGTFVILLTCLLNLKFQILSYDEGFFSISNGFMYVWLGMLFDEYKHLLNKKILLGIFSLFVALMIWNPLNLLNIRYLPCLISSLLIFPLLYQIRFSNCLTRYICKYNYELYLTHLRIYIVLLPALLTAKSNDLQIVLAFVFLTAIVCYFSELLSKASQHTIEKITFIKDKIYA